MSNQLSLAKDHNSSAVKIDDASTVKVLHMNVQRDESTHGYVEKK